MTDLKFLKTYYDVTLTVDVGDGSAGEFGLPYRLHHRLTFLVLVHLLLFLLGRPIVQDFCQRSVHNLHEAVSIAVVVDRTEMNYFY